ncbi:terminase large subunit [Streptococcus chenjunshii]|uniref:Terminase large subunit n=1 Tax=Streptococcus chenjunshii TaxID=2173853 RepID=A0A372KNR3_9STRE|nr:terminase TerL endonuclease subunit [Streptococcus chenjunshii]AXQ79433.1 terminase large subunit [Streptococcus chenjunshii]RFU51110.1 terminase large subunit [Streptococcus chenjunshii]RFU53208.1 terminase large subunit [Streptococcus chenjunshii]
MITHPYFEDYIKLIETGEIKVNKERLMLIDVLREKVLSRDDIYFDEELIDNYVRFAEKNFFPLAKYQKFITPFIFLFHKETGEVFFDEYLITLARGGGKNGFMSTRGAFFISPLYPIKNYDVTITANSEKQGKVSFEEVYETIQAKGLESHYYLTKMSITGRANNSVFAFRTNNPKTMDSARDGCLEFDEIHQFEDTKAVDVQRSGLGKVAHPRTFYNGTNGYVRGGFYDKLVEESMQILKGEVDDFKLFPFICKLDEPDEVDDISNWPKANPMLDEDTPYAKRLFSQVKKDYDKLELNPSGRQEFMTKRMNLPEADLEKDVTTREKLLATLRQPEIDLAGRSCVAGFDYASIRDFASVGLLFKNGDEFIWKQHSFVRQDFIRDFRPKAPLSDWEEQGLLTIVNEPSIDPRHLVNKLIEWREMYQIEIVCADGFRMDLLKPLLDDAGFEYEFLRNPGAIQSKVAPIIEDAFANERFVFFEDKMMLWYTDNTFVKEDGNGNKRYLKKEPVRRKTDGFHALVSALYKRELIAEGNAADFLEAIADWDF